jgi:hypothetical protein
MDSALEMAALLGTLPLAWWLGRLSLRAAFRLMPATAAPSPVSGPAMARVSLRRPAAAGLLRVAIPELHR